MKRSAFALAFTAMVASVGVATASGNHVGTAVEISQSPKVSPLCMAIVKGETDTVRKFIEMGTDVNEKSRGMTPLMYAARYNRVEIIELLIANGAEIRTKDDRGQTALKYAEQSNAQEAAALLQKARKS